MLRFVTAAALSAFALGAACAPQPIEVHAGFQFLGEQARAELFAALPARVQRDLGGVLPDPWPGGAPPLLLDLALDLGAHADLSSSSIKPASASVVRVRGIRAAISPPLKVAPGAGQCAIDGCALLLPQPTELRLYFKPQAADRHVGLSLLGRANFLADGVTRELVLDAAAAANLDSAVRTGVLELVGELVVPIDTRRSPATPKGSALVDVWIELELVP